MTNEELINAQQNYLERYFQVLRLHCCFKDKNDS